MACKYTLSAILVVAFFAATVVAHPGKKGKMMGMLSCLTEESVKSMMETMNTTMAACKAEMGQSPNGTTEGAEAATTGSTTQEAEHHHPKPPNMCVMECTWKQIGLVKDGSFVVEAFVKANVKPEHQDKVTSKFTECLTKEGLTTTYTINKDDQCKSLEKYGKCMHKAAKVCKADSSSSEEN